MFENYKNSLFNNKTVMRSQLRSKSDHDNVYTEEVNKIALNSNGDKRIQTFDGITTYPYGTNVFKVSESEMLRVLEAKAKLKMLRKECISEMLRVLEAKAKLKKKCKVN